MSGGSFCYLYTRDPVDRETHENLRQMVEGSGDYEVGKNIDGVSKL